MVFSWLVFPMHGGVRSLQRLDSVVSEKRTYTFGNVGGCCVYSPFQFLGLYLFFYLS